MNFSFEISPVLDHDQVNDFLIRLKAEIVCKPEYVAVTCGALGKQHADSLRLVEMLLQHDYAVMPHLACVRLSKAEVVSLLDIYQEMGVRHLLIVRGDAPLNRVDAKTDFAATTDLLDFIRQRYANYFKLGVAVNVSCQSLPALATGIENLAAKVHAGAEFAVSQFFYDASLYQGFLYACVEQNLAISIKPGLMPLSLKNLEFVKQAGVDVPAFWQKEIAFHQDDLQLQAWNAEKLAALATALLQMGAPGVHFFNCKDPAMLKQILEKTLWPS